MKICTEEEKEITYQKLLKRFSLEDIQKICWLYVFMLCTVSWIAKYFNISIIVVRKILVAHDIEIRNSHPKENILRPKMYADYLAKENERRKEKGLPLLKKSKEWNGEMTEEQLNKTNNFIQQTNKTAD